MLKSRINKGEKSHFSHHSVFALVGPLILKLFTLDSVWLLCLSYNCQMNKDKRSSDSVGYVLT